MPPVRTLFGHVLHSRANSDDTADTARTAITHETPGRFAPKTGGKYAISFNFMGGSLFIQYATILGTVGEYERASH